MDKTTDREERLSRLRANSRRCYYRHHEKRKESRRLRYQNNKAQAVAHLKVGRAISSGLLVRSPCVMCGDSDTHGHHADYSEPLDVVWLCKNHHSRHHRLGLEIKIGVE